MLEHSAHDLSLVTCVACKALVSSICALTLAALGSSWLRRRDITIVQWQKYNHKPSCTRTMSNPARRIASTCLDLGMLFRHLPSAHMQSMSSSHGNVVSSNPPSNSKPCKTFNTSLSSARGTCNSEARQKIPWNCPMLLFSAPRKSVQYTSASTATPLTNYSQFASAGKLVQAKLPTAEPRLRLFSSCPSNVHHFSWAEDAHKEACAHVGPASWKETRG